MGYLFSVFMVMVNQGTEAVEQVASQTDIVGIGGIFATVFCCVITCVVTWIVTMKSISQLKLVYNKQIIPILPNKVSGVNELTISYKNVILRQPCILNLEIKNTGNTAIKNCDITIKIEDDVEIIPGTIYDVIPGYEDKWKLDKIDTKSSQIYLEHINPKQVVKIRFFLTDIPKTELIFACPIPNIQTQEIKSRQDAPSMLKKYNVLEKSVLILSFILVSLGLTFELWYNFLCDLIIRTSLGMYLIPGQLVAFVVLFLFLSIFVCITRISFIDNFINEFNKGSIILESIFILLSVVGIFLIVFNYFFYGISQIVVAIIANILLVLSLYIHLVRLAYK